MQKATWLTKSNSEHLKFIISHRHPSIYPTFSWNHEMQPFYFATYTFPIFICRNAQQWFSPTSRAAEVSCDGKHAWEVSTHIHKYDNMDIRLWLDNSVLIGKIKRTVDVTQSCRPPLPCIPSRVTLNTILSNVSCSYVTRKP